MLPEVKLCIALRYFAGGSPLDLRLIYHVSKSYVYDCVWLVVDAVHKRLSMELPIDNFEKLRILEAEWRSKARCPGWVWVKWEHWMVSIFQSRHLLSAS